MLLRDDIHLFITQAVHATNQNKYTAYSFHLSNYPHLPIDYLIVSFERVFIGVVAN